MKTGTCRLCGQFKELVQAHIIPRSFALRAKGESKQLYEVRRNDCKEVYHWQNGVWDTEILCQECEKEFQAWDHYGFEMLGIPPGNDTMPKNYAEWQAFELRDIDYSRLKLFVLSMLWRASVSSQPFFSKIELGKHEPMITDMLRARNPGDYDVFAVVLARLIGLSCPTATFAPYRQRTPEGVNFNILFLPSIKIMVKVDRRQVPQLLAPFVLRAEPINFVVPLRPHRNEVESLRESAEAFRRWRSRI